VRGVPSVFVVGGFQESIACPAYVSSVARKEIAFNKRNDIKHKNK
jgi:hypothetical protein